MNRKMEMIIAQDLKMDVIKIRKLSWNELDKKPYNIFERPFRPKNEFIIGGNINLSLNREMGMVFVNIHEIIRKAEYKIKCLLKNKKTE